MALTMSKILSCSVTECAYNKNNECHTMAITVGDGEHAQCDTFFRATNKGGATEVIGAVGACKMESCEYNRSLECFASGINVGQHSGHADCKTYNLVTR